MVALALVFSALRDTSEGKWLCESRRGWFPPGRNTLALFFVVPRVAWLNGTGAGCGFFFSYSSHSSCKVVLLSLGHSERA
jgi:hypothetical protein